MLKYKAILIISILLVFISDIFSQPIKSFTPDSVVFLEEMRDFLSKNKDKKKDAKEFMDQFEEVWNSKSLSLDQKKGIYSTSNALLQKRAQAYPHFLNYLTSIIYFTKSTQDINSYYSWEKGLLNILQKKNVALTLLDDYLDVSVNLINSNYLHYSPTTKWQSSSSNWRFVYDNTIKVVFEDEINLTCSSGKDSSVIYSTKGIFYLMDQKWIGTNGKVTWERAGLNPSEVYAELRNYQIDLRKLGYQADSVTFVNTKYFNDPLYGKVIDKVINGTTPDKAIYPQFESYTKRFKIKNIYKDVDYDGGFSMKGAKFIGEGDATEPAKLLFYRNDTIFLTASSKIFAFQYKMIISENTAISIRLNTDSIYHPGLTFKFFIDKREVWLYRDKSGISLCNYINSYHKVDMDFELLTWKMAEPQLEFKFLPGQHLVATFLSVDFFSENKYLELQGLDKVNPIVAIKNFTKKINSNEFTAKQFADYMKMSIPQVHQYLMNLLFEGFVLYDLDKDIVKVKDKLFNYQSASIGKRDYDVIKFTSTAQGEDVNGRLNLFNYNLLIKGVPEIFLSDSQNVAIFPLNQEMILKKNRNFTFDGKIRAGLFLFKGSNFFFDYDNFKINLTNVDEVKMRVNGEDVDAFGQPVPVDLKSTLTNVTGDLLIDNPYNKSGIKPFPQFPIFNSKKDCYVYYDNNSIQKGVYTRDRFYFQIYPFSIDSLDNFTKKGLWFGGYFVSGGIFPPFEDTLRIQRDYSLGFTRFTPKGGLPLYGGKGNYENLIDLSNDGLRGNGTLKYVTSTTKSNDFVFFPDSMNTVALEFHNEKQQTGVEFPNVEAQNIYIHWLPYNDEMFISKIDKALVMYENQTVLHGTLKLEPKALSGWGKMDILNSETTSNLFVYKSNTFDADTAKFKIKNLDLSDLDFKTDEISAHIDFIKRKGEFKSLERGSFVEFPKVQYICYMDQFSWYMDREEIEMTASDNAQANANKQNNNSNELTAIEQEDIELEGSQFISVHPNQDSLSFIAPNAKYSLRQNIITAEKVKLIRVADATVYPGDGIVIVEKKAVMQPLINSKIIANNINRYHTIYNATTNIYGRKDYTSSGDYDFIDELKTKQKIHFDVVGVDSTKETYAKGNISITSNFTLSPNFAYTGKVQLNASKQFLSYDGSTKISHECEMLNRTWLNFKGEINPEDIYIPLDSSLKDINNNKLAAGFIISKDSIHIYSAFLSKRRKVSDETVLTAGGYLRFDNKDKKYKISNMEKLNEFNLPGNYISLHRSICNMYGEGKINLNLDLGQVKLTSVGNMNNDITKNIIECDLLLGIDFFFSDKPLDLMAKSINESTGMEAVDLSRKVFEKGLAELVGADLSNDLISQYSLKGELRRIPKELEHTLLLTDIKLKWDTKTHSYISVGKIGVGNILKNQINKMLDGHIELIKKRSGDILNIYLQIDDANWYFFTYSRGVLQAVSSNEDFNNIIKEMKPDARKLDVEKGQQSYSFYPGNVASKIKFLKKFANEENIEENNNGNEENNENTE